MFKKVLIAEDHESVSISVQVTLGDLNIPHEIKNNVYYCDDALNRIKKAVRDGEPYELLITDLSFDEDISQQITNGAELVKAARAVQPDLKVLIFSIENRAAVVNALARELNFDAFVPKARHDAKDLRLAIETIWNGKNYISKNLKQPTKLQETFEFNDLDKIIVSLLATGTSQKNIPVYLQNNNLRPSGLSSVEKRLNAIKTALNISTNEQLVAYCKDNKVI
jgi:two-component system capsular synthesis response regulator RcsB